MLDIRKLKELVRLMVSNDLTELDLRDSEEQVTLRRHGPNQPTQIVTAPVAAAAPAPAAAAAPAESAEPAAPAAGVAESDLHAITSPMVGTFYAAPNPESPAFVNVGDSIGPETVVCIVEAMKVFNEIKAECSGTIEKVLVSNGDSVEFGQPVFLVKPA
jgi:acetyl-CoA carboxylase biotin carboxyl carrier protein